MERKLTVQEKSLIREKVQEKYVRVAKSPKGFFRFPTGKQGLTALGYPSELLNAFPEALLESFCGVGNPFRLGPIHRGETILDIGCGAGLDAFLAAEMTGPEGRVFGIDITQQLIGKANEHLSLLASDHLSFEVGEAEDLLFEDQTFHVVISNGVFNLTLDKEKALQEAFRVLRLGGRLMVADMVLVEPLPHERAGKIENWYQ